MKGMIFVLVTLLIAAPAEGLHLKVDLALPVSIDACEPWPGTAKEGWHQWMEPQWWDMYCQDLIGPDCHWEPIGSGIHAAVGTGYGSGCLFAKDLCASDLGPGNPPNGSIVGEPIANTWYHAAEWVGPEMGDIVLILAELPAGIYELTSYHNHWEPGPDDPRCCRCVSPMPPMPSVTANPLPSAEQGCKPPDKPGYEELCHCGTGGGVTAIENAYDVPVTYAYSDGEVSKSVIRFQTDGSEVLVIYEAPDWGFPDCARPDREGGRAILNAFELVLIEFPPACWEWPTQCHGDADNTGDVTGPDFLAVKNSWYKVLGDPDYNPCADFDQSGQVDGADFLILKEYWYLTVPADCLCTYPACWGPDCPLQCYGDCDCDGDFDNDDFLCLEYSFYWSYPDPQYNPCADFDRNGEVKSADLLILKNSSGFPGPGPGDCPPGDWNGIYCP